jgi:hypothetical protein
MNGGCLAVLIVTVTVAVCPVFTFRTSNLNWYARAHAARTAGGACLCRADSRPNCV